MNTNWIKARQTKFTGYVTVYAVIILAILVLVNWLANRHNKSYDTTANKRFSLSDQTIKVVKELKQDVKIRVFDRTEQIARARDLLDRYDALSPKLSVDYVDPDKHPQLARSAGISEYGSIVIETGSKREEAKSPTEEEVTGSLIRALKGGQRLLCATSGAGEHGLDDAERSGYSGLKETLERGTYKTRSISLLEKAEVPRECTVLLVAGPRFDYPQPAVDAIKAHVERGGSAMLLLDPPIKTTRSTIAENAALAAMVSNWGVKPEADVVIDLSDVGRMLGFDESVSLVTRYETHPIVKTMQRSAAAFPLSRSLTVSSGAQKLFNSSETSFATTNLSLGEIKPGPSDRKGPLAMGAAGTQKGRFVVTGTSSWAANNVLGFAGNRDLALNMVNWLSADEDLISIRPKDPDDRPLSLSRLQMNMLFYTSILLIPLAVLLSGFGTWWKRR
ncbi:MAG: GldG family protein [Bryobacteraceae bacterium]